MDRRDEMNVHGTFLDSLPDVVVNTDSMTATFLVEAEPPPPPPEPEPSLLEKLGAKLDRKIVEAVDRLSKKVYASKKPQMRYDYQEWFPAPPFWKNRADRSSYNSVHRYAEDFRDLLKIAIQDRSIYRLARIHLTVIQKGEVLWGPTKGQSNPNNVQVEVVFGEETRTIRGLRLWAAFAARRVGHGNTAEWFANVPFQVGTGQGPCPRY